MESIIPFKNVILVALKILVKYHLPFSVSFLLFWSDLSMWTLQMILDEAWNFSCHSRWSISLGLDLQQVCCISNRVYWTCSNILTNVKVVIALWRFSSKIQGSSKYEVIQVIQRGCLLIIGDNVLIFLYYIIEDYSIKGGLTVLFQGVLMEKMGETLIFLNQGFYYY